MKNALLVGCLVMILGCGAWAADPWKNVTDANGLPDNQVQFVEQDSQGDIWIGTLGGLGLYKGGAFSVAIKGGQFWDILRVSDTAVWAGSNQGAILLEGDKQTKSLGGTVAPLLPYGDGRLWAISKDQSEANRLMQFADGEWSRVAKLADRGVDDIKRLADGSMLVVEQGNGLWHFVPGKENEAVHHLEGSNVTAITQDSRGLVWCGMWGGGVMVWDGTTWTRHLNKLKSSIFSIADAGKGNIWVATNDSGVWHYDANKQEWTNHLKEEGGINMLFADRKGRVWVSSQMQGGLRYRDGDQWVVSLDSPLPIRCMLETKAGELWAGGVLDGLHILKQ